MPTKNPLALTSLIAWLETKDPNETYSFLSCNHCLNAQYMRHLGYTRPELNISMWRDLHSKGFVTIASGRPWTFGAALERARRDQCHGNPSTAPADQLQLYALGAAEVQEKTTSPTAY